MLAIPTFFDLLATILMNIGLLWVTASVYQMMRGGGDAVCCTFCCHLPGPPAEQVPPGRHRVLCGAWCS